MNSYCTNVNIFAKFKKKKKKNDNIKQRQALPLTLNILKILYYSSDILYN